MSIEGYVKKVTYFIGVVLGAFVLWYAYTLGIERKQYAIIFLGACLVIYYMQQIGLGADADSIAGQGVVSKFNPLPSKQNRYILAILNLILALAAVFMTYHMVTELDRLRYFAPGAGYETLDFAVGGLAILLVTDITYRAYGLTLTSVVVAVFLYGIGGSYLPGILFHTGMSLEQIIQAGSIGMEGVFGFLLDVGATLVAIFIIFAGLARAFGILDHMIAIGQELRHITSTGVVHAAVVASMFMGSIVGSAAANTATTGSFTIPMMQDQGIEDEIAAAIESVASSAGQMLPPIMGVAAFLMADIVGVPYVTIIQAGTIPALMYYIALAFTVDLTVRKRGWTVSGSGSFDRSKLVNIAHFVIPLIVLIYALAVMRVSALTGGLYASIALVATMLIHDTYHERSATAPVGTAKRSLEGLKRGATDMAPLMAIICSLGFAISIITATGLSQRLSMQLVVLAGGVFVIVLILAMVTSILFGMGMPTPAAYILVAVLIAPTMTQIGTANITAHMFVFYFAMLSAITPPVAVAVVVAARIAEARFLVAAMHTVRFALPVFTIPFVFVYHPELITWEFPRTLFTSALAIPGLLAIAVVSTGHNVVQPLGTAGRGFYLLAGIVVLFHPEYLIKVMGVAVIALSVVPKVNLLVATVTDQIKIR